MSRDNRGDSATAKALERDADHIENLKIEPGNEMTSTELFGKPIFCAQCGEEILTVGDIRVVQGHIPEEFVKDLVELLYATFCPICGSLIDQTFEKIASNRECNVADYNRAHEGAVRFIRNGINQGLNKKGCAFCFRNDPGEKASKDRRHQVIKGSPEVWEKYPDLEVLDGYQVDPYHLKTVVLAIPGIEFISMAEAEKIKEKEREAQRRAEEAKNQAEVNQLIAQLKARRCKSQTAEVVPIKKT